MSEFATLRINRTEPSVDDNSGDDWIRIEQPDWKEPPAGGFFDWLKLLNKELSLATVLEYQAEYNSHCEEDGCLTVEIQVHKSRRDLQYAAHVSFGELSERFVHTTTHQSSEIVQKADLLALDVDTVGGVDAAWEGPVFDVMGNQVTPPPSFTVSGSTLQWNIKVSGVIRVKYTEQHDAYTLTIIPRKSGEYEAGDIEGSYQSTFFATWAEGVEVHEIDLPDMGGNCRGMGERVIIDRDPNDPDDPDGTDDETCYKHVVLVDPCTGEIKDEWDEVVPCT